MSIHAAKWAWAQKVGHPTRKLVLVALADHANADGECWPSMRLVADFAECSPRTVQRHIDALEDEGFVKRTSRRTRGDGRFSSWNYRLPVTGDAYVSDGHERPEANLTDGHERPCPPDTGDHVQRTPVSGLEPSGEPTSTEGAKAPLVDRVADWLVNTHGVEFGDYPNLHGMYDAVLRQAMPRLAGKKRHDTAMGLVCDYAAAVNGEKVPAGHRARIGRLLKAHLPEHVLYGVAQSMDWGAGLKGEHANDPDAWLNYVTAVVTKREAA